MEYLPIKSVSERKVEQKVEEYPDVRIPLVIIEGNSSIAWCRHVLTETLISAIQKKNDRAANQKAIDVDDCWLQFDWLEERKEEFGVSQRKMGEFKIEVFENNGNAVLNFVESGPLKETKVKKDAIFIYGSIPTLSEDQLMEYVLHTVELSAPDEIIFIAVAGLSENMKRSLVFENDAIRLTIEAPDMEYCVLQLAMELEKKGVILEKGVRPENVVDLIRSYRMENFCCEDFSKAINKACARMQRDDRETLQIEDFNFLDKTIKDPEEQLQRMVGLSKVKEKVRRMTTVQRFQIERNGIGYQHRPYNLAFAGNSGVGKTDAAACKNIPEKWYF